MFRRRSGPDRNRATLGRKYPPSATEHHENRHQQRTHRQRLPLPRPYDAPCLARIRKRLGDAAGLSQFGVNLLRLVPGTWSSQRHWHTGEDEFVYVVASEVVLVTDADEAHYPDIDLHALQGRNGYAHKDGRRY